MPHKNNPNSAKSTITPSEARDLATGYDQLNIDYDNLVIMKWHEVAKVVNRAMQLEMEHDEEAYVAGMFGVDDENPAKLTIILYPVVKKNNGAKFTDYEFYNNGASDRDVNGYLQQTWIDPSPNVNHNNSEAIEHFFPNQQPAEG